MQPRLFDEFLRADDTLQVYNGVRLIFSSKKDRLLPLLEYMARSAPDYPPVTVFDKIVGNAAALLLVRANCREVYSPVGSELAIRTLNSYGIRHQIMKVIPRILKEDGSDMCPMEKLSLDKAPDEFYEIMKSGAG